MTVQSSLTDQHNASRKRFANWIRTNFRKEDTMKMLFSDEKIFDIDGLYNSQNERIWAANHMETDAKGGIKRRRKYPRNVTIWLAVWSQRGFSFDHFRGRYTSSCSLHKRSASDCSPVWKQSLRESLDVWIKRWQASYPCEKATMMCRESSCVYRERPMACQKPGFEPGRLLNMGRSCISNQLEENYIEKDTHLWTKEGGS